LLKETEEDIKKIKGTIESDQRSYFACQNMERLALSQKVESDRSGKANGHFQEEYG